MKVNRTDTGKIIFKTAIWLLCIAVAVLLCVLLYGFLYKRGTFLPKWISWKEKSEKHTFEDRPGRNEDPEREIRVEDAFVDLKDKNFTISCDDVAPVWTTEDGWLVSDYFIGDIDHDEEDEIVILFWRIGSFGRHKPIWIKEDEKTWSQHIGIYDYEVDKPERAAPEWVSSRMGIEAADFFLDEEEILHIITPEGKDVRWCWINWGLTLMD
ncbi:MAG: hypothetical protein IJ619_11800 [Eubacterium sp.]|nr:hypothetical protein [Eubacterium sp.]